ncbi:LOW QUALITY PROTEIN: hypothetical protein MXB_785 [Myxobolus squamalis]|nr:LOW QUALITY PROTEIN: hypothetical protein MXB_785 [Myxobolus squamalis]
MGKKVAYFYDAKVGNYYYGKKHPMKPHRINLTHDIVFAYGLQDKMNIFVPNKINCRALEQYHSHEYIKFLEEYSFTLPCRLPYSLKMDKNYPGKNYNAKIGKLYFLFKSPYFDGLFDFCCSYTSASIDAAKRLNTKVLLIYEK